MTYPSSKDPEGKFWFQLQISKTWAPIECKFFWAGDAAEKWPNCCNGIFRHTVRSWVDGVFSETNSWVNGRPAYVNEDGHLLYMASDGTWSVGRKYGKAYVWANNSHPFNPSQSSDWLYYVSGDDKSAQIEINCT